MGACSSKPKTTEFEGSTEAVKAAEDVVVDRNTALVSQENDPIKGKDQAADESKSTEQGTRKLTAHKDEEPVVNELSSTAERASSSVEREPDAVDGRTDDGAKKIAENVCDAQKVDASDGVTEEDTEANAKTTTEGGDVGVDRGELIDDKAVVLSDSSNPDVGKGGVNADKGVAAGEETAHESPDLVVSNIADESWSSQDFHKAQEIGSPIIGVVQASEPFHVDNVSDSVSLETPETMAPGDTKLRELSDEASLTGQLRDEDVISSAEEVADLSSSLPQATPEKKEEELHDGLKSSHPTLTASDDGVGQKSEVNDGDEEVPLPYGDVQNEQTVDGAPKPETTLDSQNVPDEETSLPEEESVAMENTGGESQITVSENEGKAAALDEQKPEEAPPVHENIDEGISFKPTGQMKVEEETGEGQVEDEDMVDEPKGSDVLPPDLKVEKDVKPEAMPTSAEPSVEATDRDETDKPQTETPTTIGEKLEDMVAGKEQTFEQEKKPSAEGDLTFEDASDMPLKVEPSTEVGDRAV